MSDTAQLISASLIWLSIAIAIAWHVPLSRGTRALFAAMLIAIPFWELPYGLLNFKKLCDETSNLVVLETFSPQERVCVQELDYSLARALKDANFAQVEVMRGLQNHPVGEGFVKVVKANEVQSHHCLEFVSNVRLPWRVVRHDQSLVRVTDHRVVARQSHFDWAGMWWQEIASPLLGHGGQCSPDLSGLLRIIRSGAISGVSK